MPSSTSPNMVLFLPVPGSTAGPQWASETTSNWSTVDTHDHTAGKGVQIPIAALNVNADFSWLTFGQTNIGYAAFTDKLATGNLTVNQSLGNVAGDPYWRNASGVVKKLSLAGDALTIPSGTAVLGSLLMTNIAAPGTPAAGKVIAWADSTTRNWSSKDQFGNVSVSVVPLTAPASQWFNAVGLNGVFSTAQPAFTDVSGSLAVGQIPNSLVTYAKIQNVSATARVLGRKTAGAGVIEELTPSDVALMTGGRVVIDAGTTLSATATYTSPSWTAGLYRKIILELECSASAFTYFRFQANALATSVYTDLGTNCNSAVSVDSAPKGTNGFARVGINAGAGTASTLHLEFWPLTSGRTRTGLATSMSDGNSATLGNSFGRMVQFAFNDTATDVTFITVTVTAATMTGIAKLYGELA
jgi:hypothetical protein